MNSFKMFNVGKIFYLPYSLLKQLFTKLPKDKPLIFADTIVLKSRERVLFIKAHGYENVAIWLVVLWFGKETVYQYIQILPHLFPAHECASLKQEKKLRNELN